MVKYSTKQAGCVRKIETLGGDYALKWDDETQMSVNAHAALLSQFAKAGGFFDSLVETCPMMLTSNNAPEVRDLVATVMVSMVNGGDAVPFTSHWLDALYAHVRPWLFVFHVLLCFALLLDLVFLLLFSVLKRLAPRSRRR